MKYTCSMETVQQNGRFTLFSSKFLSIYSILYGCNHVFNYPNSKTTFKSSLNSHVKWDTVMEVCIWSIVYIVKKWGHKNCHPPMHMLSYAPVSPVLFKKGLPLTHKESIVINCRKIWFGGSLHQSRLLDSTISNYLVFSYIYGLIISCSVNLFLLFTIYLIYLKKVNLTFNCRVYWNTLYLYPVLLSEEGGGSPEFLNE